MASAPLTDLRDISGATCAPIDETRLLSADEASSPGFIAQWEALAHQASEPNPFFEHWFLLPSLAQFQRSSRAALFALFHEGVLAGLMPVEQSNLYYKYPFPHLTCWNHANMFCGVPLVARGFETAFWQALLNHCDKNGGASLFLHLPSLPVEGPLTTALARLTNAQARKSAVVHSHERAFLYSDMTAQDYFAASLSSKKRKELRRQQRRLAELGELSFKRQIGAEGVRSWTQEFLTLERAGWKGERGSALAENDATQGFFEASLEGAGHAGRLERLTLRLDDKPIAMLANFLCPPGSFSFKTAFDEEFARFSPGVLLQKENLDLLDRGDIDWCDSCAAAGHPMIERIWREKRKMASISIAIGGALRRSLFSQLLRAESHEPFAETQGTDTL